MGKVGWIIGGVVYLVALAAAAYTAHGILVPLVIGGIVAAAFVFGRRQNRLDAARNESLFVSMFPDLQPYYHPKQLYDYTVARLSGKIPRNSKVKDPPGFTGYAADVRAEAERDLVRILDAAGTLVTQFIFEKHPEGAAIRVGKGKFTLTTGNPQYPRVRYWHPDREFKWTPLTWKFMTPVVEREFSSSDRSSSSDSTSSSSSSSRVASAAPFAAAGGAFDGGGASQSWSEGGASASGSASTSY